MPLSVLKKCDGATLKISNQKNGKKDQMIYHKANYTSTCPVRTLAEIVAEIYSFTKDEDILLCSYKQRELINHVRASDVTNMLRKTAKIIDLPARGFPLSRISPHSLRAGGATALAIAKLDIIVIQKYGR